MKSNGFSYSFRELSSQDKTPPHNLERQVNAESQSQELLPWSRSRWSHKLVGTLKRQF